MGSGDSPTRCVRCGGYLLPAEEPPGLWCDCGRWHSREEPPDEATDPSERPNYYENNSAIEEEEE